MDSSRWVSVYTKHHLKASQTWTGLSKSRLRVEFCNCMDALGSCPHWDKHGRKSTFKYSKKKMVINGWMVYSQSWCVRSRENLIKRVVATGWLTQVESKGWNRSSKSKWCRRRWSQCDAVWGNIPVDATFRHTTYFSIVAQWSPLHWNDIPRWPLSAA